MSKKLRKEYLQRQRELSKQLQLIDDPLYRQEAKDRMDGMSRVRKKRNRFKGKK